jgi:hypothetical protein
VGKNEDPGPKLTRKWKPSSALVGSYFAKFAPGRAVPHECARNHLTRGAIEKASAIVLVLKRWLM